MLLYKKGVYSGIKMTRIIIVEYPKSGVVRTNTSSSEYKGNIKELSSPSTNSHQIRKH
jgi:hypothetical protein